MSDFFYSRYQQKTNDQLQAIIDDKERYQSNAVDAAVRILQERSGKDVEPVVMDFQPAKVSKIPKKGFFDLIFDIQLFRTTFCFQDVLTWITLSMASIAFLLIVNYYTAEPWMEDNFLWITFVFLGLATLCNHIIFRVGHKRSNNVIGRMIHDFGYWILFVLICEVYFLLIHGRDLIGNSDVVAIIIFLVFASFIIEFFVAILKRFLLTLFKLEIL